jgi:hypothetical protein
MVLAREVVGFETRGPVHAVLFEGPGEIEARALIVATGVSYRRLGAAGLDELIGRGVYYGVTASEASQCRGDEVYIIGAANSAAQAALNLSRFAKRVVLLVRAATLTDTMSRYLVERIASTPSIEVRYRSEVVAGRGDGHLEALTLADRASGVTEEVPIELAVRLHRSLTSHRMAGFRGGPRRARVCRHRSRPPGSNPRQSLAAVTRPFRTRDERAGSFRRGRRSTRLHEAGRVGGG